MQREGSQGMKLTASRHCHTWHGAGLLPTSASPGGDELHCQPLPHHFHPLGHQKRTLLGRMAWPWHAWAWTWQTELVMCLLTLQDSLRSLSHY